MADTLDFVPDTESTDSVDFQPETQSDEPVYYPPSFPPTRAALAAKQLGNVNEPFKPFVSLGPDIQGTSIPGQAVAAVYNTGKKFVEGAESPGGVALLPFGAAGKGAEAVMGAGFGIPAFTQGVKRVYQGAALAEPQEVMEGVLEALTGGLITTGAARRILPKSTQESEKLATEIFKQETPDAETIRSDTGQPNETGKAKEGGPTDSGGDLQQAPSGAPNAPTPRQAQRPLLLTPEEQAIEQERLQKELGFVEESPPSGDAGEANRTAAGESGAVEPPVAAGGTPQAIPQGNVTTPVTQVGNQPTLTGMGGALKEGEIPETGAGGEKYGVAERIREERAKAGQTDPVPPGQGVSTQATIERGREIIRNDPEAPERIMSAFEDDPQKNISADGMAAARAHGEALAAGARNIEEQFGTESPEYQAAKDALSSWDKRSKAMQTEWHKLGMAQQGETDIDTGSFTGIERAVRDATDKDIPLTKKPRARKIAQENKQAQESQLDASDKLKARIRQKNPVDAEKAAVDAANKTVREAAARMAEAENKARVAKEARKQSADQVQRDAAQSAQEAASDSAANAAVRKARAENKARLEKAKRDKQIADIQVKAAQRALGAARDVEKQVRERAIKNAQKRASDPSIAVWEKANQYLDENKGIYSFDDIRHKIATDLGISVDRVTNILAQDPITKRLADDLWNKQRNARRLKESAKEWIKELYTPGYQKALSTIPRAMFSLKVGLHGTVALGTHAPMVAFQPRFWNAYFRDFGKMYKLVFSPTYYERQVQDLVRRPNYELARRAGLQNDPFQYEEYHTSTINNLVKDWIGEKNMERLGKLTSGGNRGYSVLKILRQDMFDQMYDQLPRIIKVQKGVADAIADGVNHATGVVKGKAPAGSNVALFAPRLEGSRVMWLGGDPIRATKAFLDWKNAPEAEKQFAMNQVKEKAWVFGTFATLLALNQGFLSAAGSKQKINGIPKSLGGAGMNPLSSDFLKFKAAGFEASYGSAMANMAKLPVRMATAIAFQGKTSKLILEDERVYDVALGYLRTQLSPFAGTVADVTFGRDYAGRPLPRKALGLLPGDKDVPKRLRVQGITKPYSWTEYSSQQFSPIPISEGIREVWKGMGMPSEQQNDNLKALIIISIMAGTGARVTEEPKPRTVEAIYK